MASREQTPHDDTTRAGTGDGAGDGTGDGTGDAGVQRYLRRITVIAALGGFLFGYDTGVISGALLYITPAFHLSSTGQQIVVASLLLGAVVGAFLSGPVNDALGRKRSLLLAAAIFALGALASAVSPGTSVLVGARFVIGLGLGFSSMTVPLYLAEMSPKASRGRVVSMNQFLIVVGILVSYGVGYLLAEAEAWRWMLGLAAVPAVLMFAGLLGLPESPRWLLGRDREDEALDVLRRTRPADEVDDEAAEMRETIADESQGTYRALFARPLRPALRIGVGVPTINQLVGVNAVIYYTPTILKQTGFGDSAALLGSVGVGVVNVALTVTALLLIDRVGRRPLLLTGTAVLVAALFALGGLYLLPSQDGAVGLLIVVGLCLYIGAFAASLGIGIWLYTSEVYPTHVRAKGASLGVCTHWGLDFVISLTVLTLIDAITLTGMFWLYGALGLAGFFYLRRYLPETRNRSLEDIGEQLTDS